MRLEYWTGSDPTRSEPRGWAAVVRAYHHGREAWVVVVTLEGARHSWTGPFTGTPIAALCAALSAIGALTTPASASAAPSEQHPAPPSVVRDICAVVEPALAGAPAPPANPPGAGLAAPPRPAPQRTGARDRVLDLPMLTESQVQDLFDGQRDHPAIVRGLRKAGVIIGLPYGDDRLFPAFQFTSSRLDPIVAATNLAIAAERDHWRAAMWWTTPNPALGCPPLDLLYRPGEHDRLLNAARAQGLRRET